MRVYELAAKMKMETKTLIEKLGKLNIKVKNHMSSLTANQLKKAEQKIGSSKEQKDKKAKTKAKGKKTAAKKKTKTKKPTKEKRVTKPRRKKVSKKTVIEKEPKETIEEISVEKKEAPTPPIDTEPRVKEKIPPPPLEEKVELPRIKIDESINVNQLATKLNIKTSELIKKLMDLGILATINQRLETDTATLAAHEFSYDVEVVPLYGEELLKEVIDEEKDLKPRFPIVTVMGHVDHGKTSLLDAIRESKITQKESGGITQHIGAYKIDLDGNKGSIVFLDTPGHEAFTAMRARGAQVTDIVILVVAADDGIMPQTVEAIDHARAANVPIIVVINKIDLPNANPQKVKEGLANHGLVPEDWGGDIIVVEVSAKEKLGLDDLLDMIHLQAEMLELKVNPYRNAIGTVVEAKLDKRRGPMATVLIQKGTLRINDAFISSFTAGKVKAMVDEHGRKLKEAIPSMPVGILGFYDLPQAGDTLQVVDNEQTAKKISSQRKMIKREENLTRRRRITLEDLYTQMKEGKIKELNLIIKADVRGSVEALRDSLEKLSTSEIKTNIIHSGVGGINDSDVILAKASNCIIIGYNVRPSLTAEQLAKKEDVDIHTYRVIYEAVENIKKAMEGLLDPEFREKMLGRAVIKELFKVPKIGTIAGCSIQNGKIVRNSKGRILRNDRIIYEGKISSLRHFKEDVKELGAGNECGIGLENFNDLKESDIIESFELEKFARKL